MNFGFLSGGSGGGGGMSGLTYLGTWDASLNIPLITSGVGTAGDYYIVNVAGNTNIDGISDWGVGDWIIFSSSGVWQKIDNSDLEGYNLIENQGVALPKESIINFRGAGVVASAGVGKTDVTINTSGGGASTNYYLNGSINQGVFGGNTYYQLSRNAITGAGTDFSLASDGIVARFITDANDPYLTNLPNGNWICGFYFSASSSGGSPQFYLKFYKYDGAVFTLIADNTLFPETITGGTSIDQYFFSVAFPTTSLAITDRIAVEVYVVHDGRTITLHTEDSHVCEIITTFSTGILSLNGLTKQIQVLNTGTSGTDFGISSVLDTHTFNLPIASALNTGKLSNLDWTTFNNKLDQAYQTIQEEGGGLPQRDIINFIGAGVTATDDALNNRTNVTIAGETFGKFGIADSNGVYTYYNTLALAMASAVSGQCVEFFADYVESGLVTVALVNGVNVNMNGHTYTATENVNSFSLFSANGVQCQFTNGTIIIDTTSVTQTITAFNLSNGSDLDCSGIIVRAVGTGGLGRGANLGTTGCTLRNLTVINKSSSGINAISGANLFSCNCSSENGVGIVLGNTLATSGTNFAYNCIGISLNNVGFSVNFNSTAIECVGRSSSSLGFSLTAGNIIGGYCSSGSGITPSLSATTSASITANNFSIRGLTILGAVSLIYASGGIGATGRGTFVDCSVVVGASTDAITVNTNGVYTDRISIANCSIRVTSVGNKCIVGSAVNTYCNYANNSFFVATTPVDTSILQGIVNTQDNQGNILIQN